jgi:hypothetical protein
MVEFAVGTHKAESGPDEGPLRRDVIRRRVGNHPGQSLTGGHGQQGGDRLRGISVAAGRRSQAIADLDPAAGWLALEADSSDGSTVGQAGDPVVPERPLLSALGSGAKKGPHGADVALEGEIVRPTIIGACASSDDAFPLGGIDRVQLQARCSRAGHSTSEAPPVPKHHRVSKAIDGCGARERRVRFADLYLEALDEAGMPADEPFRQAVLEHVEFGSQVAMQNSNAASDDELHPLRDVPRWTWTGDERPAPVP